MRKYYLFAIIFLSLTSQMLSQNYFPWYKIYGESIRAIDIYQTFDSCYIIAGQHYQFDQVWLFYADYMGDTLWSKTYNDLCSDDDILFVRSVIQTADGGYAILSNCVDQYLTTKDIVLLKTNQIGEVEFLGRYERGYVYDFIEAKDGGFIIAGKISGGTGLLKINSQGDSIWTQVYNLGDRSYARSIKVINDSQYVVTGSVEVGVPPSDKNVFILQINSTGDTLLSRVFEVPNSNDFVLSVDVTDYGNYIVAGRTEAHYGTNRMFIMKIDSNFNEVWKTHTQSDMSTTEAINYKSNSYLLVGNSGFPYSTDIVICEVDSLGNILYYRYFNVFSYQHAYSVIKRTDSSYVIVGGISDPKLLILEGTDNPITGLENNNNSFPIDFCLSQNFPNPFNPKTKINYNISELSYVTIKIYDVLGNEIATLVNEEKSIGSYEIEWNATAVPSGVYFYRIQAGSFVETKKMVLMK